MFQVGSGGQPVVLGGVHGGAYYSWLLLLEPHNPLINLISPLYSLEIR